MPHNDRSRIVLLGWYGSNNTGDEALAEVIVQQLKRDGFDNIVALSTNPAKTSARLGVASTSRSLFNLDSVRTLAGAKALVLGGGGLIQDGTSVYNLPIYTAYVALSRLLGVRVIGWGLGVEPLWTLLGRLQARFICKVASHFSVRDTLSKHLLVRAGVPADLVKVTADPAVLLEPEEVAQEWPDDGRPTIIFCVRHLPMIRPGLRLDYLLPVSVRHRLGLEQQQDAERTNGVIEATARGIKVAVQELGARVVLLPLWPGRDDEMLDEVEEAARKLGVPQDAVQRAEVGDRPGNFAGLIGKADLLVSMRLHALVFAAAQGVPMLALSYARKVRGFMRDLGFERWVVEVETRTPPPEELEMKLRQLWAIRYEESERLQKAARRARRRAEEDGEEIARLLRCDETT